MSRKQTRYTTDTACKLLAIDRSIWFSAVRALDIKSPAGYWFPWQLRAVEEFVELALETDRRFTEVTDAEKEKILELA